MGNVVLSQLCSTSLTGWSHGQHGFSRRVPIPSVRLEGGEMPGSPALWARRGYDMMMTPQY